jgi:hypothetical protein
MSQYFSNFPLVQYRKKTVRDISKRIRLMDKWKSDGSVLLPYTIEDNHRPEDIANLYYGSVDYTWLVCLVNDVIDPYEDWLMTDDALQSYMMKKYEKRSRAKGFDIIRWTMNARLTENISHFTDGRLSYSKDTVLINHVAPENYFMIDGTKNNQSTLIATSDFGDKRAVRFYEYEQEVNEMKRKIHLIDKRLLSRAVTEFKEMING